MMGFSRDKLEDMDVSLKMSASLKGPTLQTWITKKWPNIFMCFFRIWKYGIFVAICSWFHPFLSNCLLMRAFWKKVFKNLFLELGRKMWFSEKRQKLLYFDKALWPNHLTYSKPLGISGKTNVHIFHLVPRNLKSVLPLGHSGSLKMMAP